MIVSKKKIYDDESTKKKCKHHFAISLRKSKGSNLGSECQVLVSFHVSKMCLTGVKGNPVH